jgi:hypothetical protein
MSSVVTVLACFVAGCQTSPQARVIRLKLDSDSIHWQYSVNGHRKTSISGESLTNQLSRLHLQHGDMILFGMVPIRSAGSTSTTWDWLSHYCDSNQIATYDYNGSPKGDIFSEPVYHWVAPFNNPRTLVHASFFYEGEFLGYKTNGYQNMLCSIERMHPHQIFILGSLYDLNTNFGPYEAPYENEERFLKDIVNKNGIELLLLNPLFGF